MEKQRKTKIQKWDETQGVVETTIEETEIPAGEIAGAGPALSKNPMKGIEDMIEQNDNNLDGVINNLPEQKPVSFPDPVPVSPPVTEEDAEAEKKKRSIRKKLQEAAPERGKKAYRCIDCGDPVRC